ncbi:MoaD/ThiS family protein [Acidithiobacillus ferrianus]|uniref:MoaD/ThiS family protein n=1 Tax=Acidithiobacillus ferrianus TaxID=2678518 RepID=UPI0034E59447
MALPFSKVHMQVIDLLQVVERHTGCCLQSAYLLAAVNLEHISMSTELQDNDEVAFFPPVTGG